MTKTPQTHLVIPDTQIKPGVPTVHLEWIGRYIVDEFLQDRKPLTVVHLGDHWDMPSLSSYDKGRKAMEGRRVSEDIDAGNEGMRRFWEPIVASRRSGSTRFVYLGGNHEERINRAVEADAQLDGVLSLDQLDLDGWESYDFLAPVTIDGVTYAHYIYNPATRRPYGGQNLETRLKTVGHSFTVGHIPGRKFATRETLAGTHNGLEVGSCYLHNEEYVGPQGNRHWRGIVICHQVEDGDYDPMFVSLDYLARRYTGHRLSDFSVDEWAED